VARRALIVEGCGIGEVDMNRRQVRGIAGIALVLSAIVFVFLWGYSAFRMPGPDPPQTSIELETDGAFPPMLAFSSDSRWLAFTANHSVKLCDMNAGGAVKTLHEFNEDAPSSVAFTPDSNEVLVGTWSNRMYVLEIASGAVRETISFDDRSRVLRVAVSSVDDWVAVNVLYEKSTGPNSSKSDSAIEIFRLANSAARQTLIAAGADHFVTFSPNGHLLAAIDREQNLVRVWTMPDAKQVYEIPRSANEFFSIAFDPSSEKLAFGGQAQRVHIWSLAENRQIDSWSARSYVRNLAFHPSGDVAAMCNHHRPNFGLEMDSSIGATISIWNSKGRRRNTFRAFDVAAEAMAISPDGKHLAASGVRRGSWQVKVWDWEIAAGVRR